MKNRGDHSINRPGAWTHSGQGVEEVFLYQPRREYVTKNKNIYDKINSNVTLGFIFWH